MSRGGPLSIFVGIAIAAWLMLASTAGAATLLGDYQLQGTRASSGPGPTLIDVGAGGSTFVTDNVMGVSRQVYAFPIHSGVMMTPAGLGGSDPAYSVVTTFRFETVDGYRRILDSSNGTLDRGFYVYSGYVRHSPSGVESSNMVLANNVYATVAITSMPSPATTKVYVNGSPVLAAPLIEPVAADTLRFFKDNDTPTTDEDSGGAVSCIRVFSGVLTDAEIAAIGANPRCGAAAAAPAATCKGKPATIVGTEGKDVRKGTSGKDVIVGLGGNDKLSGLAGNDVICGGSGKDTLNGGKGGDKLYGEEGKDTLKGGAGKDKLNGGPGKDKQVQ
jgi:RTX calcium-binding nonapeptide repeat (4 copies)